MTSGTARQRLLWTVALTAYFTMSLTAQELSKFGNAETHFLVGDALDKGTVQPLTNTKTPLSIDSIFLEKQFAVEPFKGRWQNDSQGFELIKKDVEKEITSVIRIGLDQLKTEEVLVPGDWLKPTPADKPLAIDAYEWSTDRTKLLIFTNTKRVWRLNTRGDYWVLDLPTKRLSKIGGDSPESSLMFAKFSPDGKNVAYVRDRDIYIQDLLDEKITRLTTADALTKINGTFDWAYEEEFSLRDGFRFSPDGKRIAFWEIDGSEIELFPLVDNTSTLYPKIQFIPYPKVGTTNPGARIGTIELESSTITWMQIPGDVRNNYLPRMKWIDDKQLAIQQLNRTQNHLQLYVADAISGDTELIFTETDAGWIDVRDELIWLKDKTQFVWLSERTGWQHIYLVSRDGKTVKAVTSGDFDVIDVLGIDEPAELVYFYASPDTGTQKYLYRVKLDGSELARVTPQDQPGTHVYILSPDSKRALVTSSQFCVPPVTRFHPI